TDITGGASGGGAVARRPAQARGRHPLGAQAASLHVRRADRGMSLDEVPVILDLIDEIKSEADKTVLLVEHRMDVIKRLADRIGVLQDGTMIADGPPAEGGAVAA